MCAATCACLFRTQASISKRDQGYQTALSNYSAAFQPGAKRATVEDYFRTNKTGFRQLCCVPGETSAFADLVQIGRNHDGWPFCSGATINVAFVFVSARPHPFPRLDPEDTLKTIELFTKAENCL
jgi:hypothetical protein